MDALRGAAYAMAGLALAGCAHAPPSTPGPRGLMGASALDAQACFGMPAKKEATATGELWTYYRSRVTVTADVASAKTDVSSCIITLEVTRDHVTSMTTRPIGPDADPLVCADLAAACAH